MATLVLCVIGFALYAVLARDNVIGLSLSQNGCQVTDFFAFYGTNVLADIAVSLSISCFMPVDGKLSWKSGLRLALVLGIVAGLAALITEVIGVWIDSSRIHLDLIDVATSVVTCFLVSALLAYMYEE